MTLSSDWARSNTYSLAADSHFEIKVHGRYLYFYGLKGGRFRVGNSDWVYIDANRFKYRLQSDACQKVEIETPVETQPNAFLRVSMLDEFETIPEGQAAVARGATPHVEIKTVSGHTKLLDADTSRIMFRVKNVNSTNIRINFSSSDTDGWELAPGDELELPYTGEVWGYAYEGAGVIIIVSVSE